MTNITCAWDVGIKNLAYCILDNSTDKTIIKGMGIVNLIEDTTHNCTSLLKNKKVCNKNAIYVGKMLSGESIYYCGSHKKLHDEVSKIVDTDLVKQITMATTLCERAGCKLKQKYNILGSNVCNAHKTQMLKNYKKEYELYQVKKVNCNKMGLEYLGETMFSKVDKIPELLNVSKVYIENQPSLLCPNMKSVSMLLFSYYLVNKKNGIITDVKFIAPSGKLDVVVNIDGDVKIKKALEKIKSLLTIKVDDSLIVNSITNKPLFETMTDTLKLDMINKKKILKNAHVYELTKLLSTRYALDLIAKDYPEWLPYINSLKKKDDVADAFLHALNNSKK
jgi:hypothetical protein